MIINSKSVSLSEAAAMTGKSEQEVLDSANTGTWNKVSLKAVRHE